MITINKQKSDFYNKCTTYSPDRKMEDKYIYDKKLIEWKDGVYREYGKIDFKKLSNEDLIYILRNYSFMNDIAKCSCGYRAYCISTCAYILEHSKNEKNLVAVRNVLNKFITEISYIDYCSHSFYPKHAVGAGLYFEPDSSTYLERTSSQLLGDLAGDSRRLAQKSRVEIKENEIDHSKVGAYKISMPKAFDKILMLGLTKMKDELHEKVVHEAQVKKEAQKENDIKNALEQCN
ncbi:MAG: hypothetical protein KBT30_00855 [Clostridiales bacterium]|nr:hypothetical protein [Candidatus Apopatousia equi]